MNELQAAMVATIKQWALANYENGLDFVVECYSTADIAEALEESDWDVETLKARLLAVADVYADRMADAINSAF